MPPMRAGNRARTAQAMVDGKTETILVTAAVARGRKGRLERPKAPRALTCSATVGPLT
jgi:hypothetical protein